MWVEVSKEEFFSVIGPMDVNPVPTGPYPYVSIFEDPKRYAHGKIENGGTGKENRYYLRKGN